jgi:CRISPR-associated exonuclease Cas4
VFAEDDLLPLSALQHLLFCERQAALIHLEGQWLENRFTAEGRVLHERPDTGRGEERKGVRIARGLPLRSLRLGLVGRADVVEFHRLGEGRQRVVPIEYKRGRPKAGHCDEVQLCAQALCLEEMLDLEVPVGALFYGKRRRRTEVRFDAELRARTEAAVRRLRQILESRETPPPVADERCKSCSLRPVCLPSLRGRSASSYLSAALAPAVEPT